MDFQASALVAAVAAPSEKDKSTNVKGHEYPLLFLLHSHGWRPTENENMPRIVGWDAAGEVIAAGPDCIPFENYIRNCYYFTKAITTGI